MSRGPRIQKNYTGKAAKLDEKIKELEAQVKAMKGERDRLYKEQLKLEKRAERAKQSDAEKDLIKMIRNSGMSPEDVLNLIASNESDVSDQQAQEQEEAQTNGIESDIIE